MCPLCDFASDGLKLTSDVVLPSSFEALLFLTTHCLANFLNSSATAADDKWTTCKQGTLAAMLQGIKFYEPEVVGATPEAVEYRGMQNLVEAVKEHMGYRHGKLIFSADGQVGQVRSLYAWVEGV